MAKKIVILAILLLTAHLAKADDVTFRFSPGQLGPEAESFTIPSTYATYATNGNGVVGPVFSVSIDGAPWTFALDEEQDAGYYTEWFGPGIISPNQVPWNFSEYIPDNCDYWLPFGFCPITWYPQPFDGQWIPGNYSGYTITAGTAVVTPEPNTGLLVGAGAFLLMAIIALRRR